MISHYYQHLGPVSDLVEEARREQREREPCGPRSHISNRDMALPQVIGNQVLLST